MSAAATTATPAPSTPATQSPLAAPPQPPRLTLQTGSGNRDASIVPSSAPSSPAGRAAAAAVGALPVQSPAPSPMPSPASTPTAAANGAPRPKLAATPLSPFEMHMQRFEEAAKATGKALYKRVEPYDSTKNRWGVCCALFALVLGGAYSSHNSSYNNGYQEGLRIGYQRGQDECPAAPPCPLPPLPPAPTCASLYTAMEQLSCDDAPAAACSQAAAAAKATVTCDAQTAAARASGCELGWKAGQRGTDIAAACPKPKKD